MTRRRSILLCLVVGLASCGSSPSSPSAPDGAATSGPPSLLKSQEACETTRRTLITASEAYQAQAGAYAASLQDLSGFATELPATGNTLITQGGALTYVPATGAITGTCG